MKTGTIVSKIICYLGVIFLLAGFLSTKLSAQPEYKIQIDKIDRTIYKNFLGIPKTVDYHISWRVLEYQNGRYVDTNIEKLNKYELIYTQGDSSFQQANTVVMGQSDSCEVSDLKVGNKYFFKVQAFDENNKVYRSQTAWMRTGRQASLAAAADEDEGGSWLWYLPISGRFPLTFLGYGQVFDKATILGKFAFHVIWWFLIFGVITIFYCLYNLRLSKIFPLESLSLKARVFPFNYEAVLQNRKNDVFFGEDGTIDRWKNVIAAGEKLFETPPKREGDRAVDIDKLPVQFATWWRDVGREKVKEIRKDIEEFKKYPTARIIDAGLANHEINGYKFMAASEEVDRAIENRAMMELEQIKGKTKLDWLWNLGATAPLIGLFGTVTGISVAFRKLALQSERGIIDTSTKISELAGGINEALWTTIFGLSTGIILVLFYYFFKNKLDWIYGKWEEIYVDVSEKL